MKTKVGIVVFILLLAVVSISFAERELTHLGADAVNAAMVWTEVPRAIYERSIDDGPVAGVLIGPLNGSYNLIEKTAKGIEAARDHKPTRDEVSGLRLIYKF